MATSTTTASAIRAQQVSDIEALTPSSFDGVPFREHREQEEFDTWLEANTAACFRRFQVVDQIDYELSDRSGADIEVILARFTLSVAYPKDGRYGFTNETDVTAVLEEDHLAIDKVIGILGAENYVAGQQSCVIDSVELEDNGSHWLVVYELTVQFNLSTGYAGGAFSHAGAGTTTASAIKAAQAGLIHALTPSTHSGAPFQEHRRGGVFEQWAAQAERGAFRRFHINPGYSYTSPLYTNFSAEQIQTTFEVQVAYPRDRRFGTGTEYDARQVIAEDAAAIIVAIGSIGTGSYAAGHHGTVFESSTLDENGDGWMLRLEFEVSFSKAPAFVAAVSGDVGYTLDSLTPADISAITGMATPTLFWDAGVASGADELVDGTYDLVDIDAPSKQQNDAILGGLSTVLTGLTADSLDAQSTLAGDVGADTVTGLLIFRFTEGGYGGGFRGVMSKRSGGGAIGYAIDSSNQRNLILTIDTGATAAARTISADHGNTNGQVVLFTRSVADNNVSLYSREGSATGVGHAGSLSNAVLFAIGASFLRSTNPGIAVAKAALWIGTDGDGAGESQRLAVSQALGYET